MAGHQEASQEGQRCSFRTGFDRVQRADRGDSASRSRRYPRGSERVGTNSPNELLAGSGINASFAIYQTQPVGRGSVSWRWGLRSVPVSVPTTFEKEVYSDLTGERGVLMGRLPV